jgi:hypothetical protein
MQQSVMVSPKADDDAYEPALALDHPMAHQSECVHGNEPIPQIMIQLVGCHIEMHGAAQMGKVRAH